MKRIKLAYEENNLPEVFHDQAVYFMNTLEPDAGETLTLRLRAVKGALKAAEIAYRYGGKTVTHPMKNIGAYIDKTGRFEFFEGSFTVPEKAFIYRFIITAEDGRKFHYIQRCPDCLAVQKDVPFEKDDEIGTAAFGTVPPYGWEILPGFHSPKWARGLLWYSIPPDAFFNGDPTNDDTHSDNNYDQPWNLAHNALNDRYGGDFQGIMDKIDYFKDLGVEGVFMNPINKSDQNMGYGTTDFGQIESSFGGADKYRELISFMHGNGMRLMQDVVISFTTRYGYYVNQNGYWPKEGCFDHKTRKIKKGNRYYSMICNADEGGREEWGGLYLNNCDRVTKDLLYLKPNSALVRYADKKQGFGVDSYRFDCGGWITGHKGTLDKNEYTESQKKSGYHNPYVTSDIMHKIRKSIRAVNPEFEILSESSGAQLRAGAWDSQWNLGLNDAFHKYIDGEMTLEDIRIRSMLWSTWEKPRGTALCSNNQINTHDRNANKKRPENASRWRAAHIIQMTAVGSPSIYYGDETNFSGCEFVGSNGSNSKGFSYFDWQEANWEYDVNHFVKALCELHKEYPVLKEGAIAELYLTDRSFDYVRFDDNTAVFTLTETSDKPVKRKLNAYVAGLADGTVLTDWFTGAEYTVKYGVADITITNGGTVLVTDGKTSHFRCDMAVSSVGKEKGTKNVLSVNNEKAVRITANDAKLGKDDDFTFVSYPAFGWCSITGDVTAKPGSEGAVMIRGSLDADAPFYAATVRDGKVTVKYRATYGGNVDSLPSVDANGTVRIERLADNTVRLHIYGRPVENSEKIIDLRDKVLCGFTSLMGTCDFKAQRPVELGFRLLCDKFTGGVPTSFLSNTEGARVEDNKLIVPAGNTVTARTPDNDWTFKAEIDYTPKSENDYAGVVSKQSDKIFITVGKRLRNGVPTVFFAKTSSGKTVIIDEHTDPHPESAVTLQIERIGSHYCGAYAYDGVWTKFDRSAFYNLSSENAGVTVFGKKDASVTYLSFGDAVNDGRSTFMPISGKEFSPDKITYHKHYKLRFVKGKWGYDDEGFVQTDEKEALVSVVNRKYTSFRAEAAYSVSNKSGFAGMSFGMDKPSSGISDSYSLRYDGKKISLNSGETVIAKASLTKAESPMRLTLEIADKKAVVYESGNALPVIEAELPDYKGGYFAFCTSGTEAHINNYNICASDSEFYCSGNNIATAKGSIFAIGDGNNTAWTRGRAYTDFIINAVIEQEKFSPNAESHAGLLICGPCGVQHTLKGAGLYVKIQGNELTLNCRDKVLASYQLQSSKKVALKVEKSGKTVKVYVGENQALAITYKLSVDTGTVPGFVSVNTLTKFTDVLITPNTEKEDMSDEFSYV